MLKSKSGNLRTFVFAMKLLVITLILFSNSVFAQSWVGQAPVEVASGYGNYHPQTEMLADGNPAVIWTDGTTNNLYFSKLVSPNTFSTPVQVNPAGTLVQDYTWSGPDLAVWNTNIYVIYHDLGFETGHVYLVKSTDTGTSFSDTVRVDNLTGAHPQFPDVTVFNDTVFVTYMVIEDGAVNPQYFFSRSADGWLSFEPAINITEWIGAEACDCCQPEIVADQNRIVVFYRQNASDIRDIKAIVSYDRGSTFTNFYSPDNHNWFINSCPSTGPDARFMSNGNPVSVYRTMLLGAPAIFINQYDLYTDAVVAEEQVFMDGMPATGMNFPQLDIYNDVVGIVWEGVSNGTDIFFNTCSDGIGDLSSANALNLTDLSGAQSKPDVAAESNFFHVFYAEQSGAKVMYIGVQPVNSLSEELNSTVGVYPNPASSYVTIGVPYDGNFSFVIYSAGGIALESGEVVTESKIAEFNISSFSAGIYFIAIATQEGNYVARISKE